MRQQLDLTLDFGAPGEIRTPDPQVRSLVLYPAELRARTNRPWCQPSLARRLGLHPQPAIPGVALGGKSVHRTHFCFRPSS